MTNKEKQFFKKWIHNNVSTIRYSFERIDDLIDDYHELLNDVKMYNLIENKVLLAKFYDLLHHLEKNSRDTTLQFHEFNRDVKELFSTKPSDEVLAKAIRKGQESSNE